MELSALLAVAKFREIDFAEFLIAEDTFYPESVAPIERENQKILDVAIEIINSI